MDKLIEAAQGLIALGPPERAQDQLWSTWQKRVKAYNLLVAAASHAAESTAQLDAEDPAEPVEDVVSRMCELMGGCACEHCIKRMTAALAVANQVRDDQWEATVKTQYYSADVIGFPAYIQAIKARLAPKPEPSQSAVIDTLRSEDFQRANACIECGTLVVHQELHVKWHAALEQENAVLKARLERLSAPVSDEEVYVAWLRWAGDENHRHLIVCDSDDERAFKVYRRPTSPASHAAESAPMLPSDTLHICAACWAGNHGSCSGGKCGCVHESASVAQDWRFMESETKLKPCPFCGGTPHLQCDHKFFVLCLNCHCAVGERYDPDGWPAHEFSTAADAIAAWNTRVSSSSDVKGGNDAK